MRPASHIPLADRMTLGVRSVLIMRESSLVTLMRSPGAKKEAGPSGKPLSYVNGFLLQFLNVHILMLGIAAYSGYILPHGYTVPAVLCFSVIMAACAATGNLIWATLGALLYPLYSRYYKFVNAVMALLLLWCAWKIISV